MAGIDDPKDYFCFLDFAERAFYADVFYDVGGGPDAGGVDEAECGALDCYGVFNGVAGCAVYVADDGFVFMKELVEECAFAYVGFSDDGYRDAVLEGVAESEGVGETADYVLYFFR